MEVGCVGVCVDMSWNRCCVNDPALHLFRCHLFRVHRNLDRAHQRKGSPPPCVCVRVSVCVCLTYEMENLHIINI